MDFPKIPNFDLRELLTNVGIPFRTTPPATDRTLLEVDRMIDAILRNGIAYRHAEDFKKHRDASLNNFARCLRAKSDLIRVMLDPGAIESVVSSALSDLEADFLKEGADKFGKDACEQAVFALWSFKKTGQVVSKLNALRLPEGAAEQDRLLADHFAMWSIWAQYHLSCLLVAMRHNTPIYPEVLSLIVEGLRAVVNAHGIAVEALALRRSKQTELDAAPTMDWDDGFFASPCTIRIER